MFFVVSKHIALCLPECLVSDKYTKGIYYVECKNKDYKEYNVSSNRS